MTASVQPGTGKATLLVRGGRVYDPHGDVHAPPVRDILIEDGIITAVTCPDEDIEAKQSAARRGDVLDATGKLVMPGFVNAHYHSYDTLAKGLFEDMPFDIWALVALPAAYGARSRAELRARTLLGALECIKHGITTVQDMCTVVPLDEETLDVILAAYEEAGIRVVFSIGLRDLGELDIAPFLPADIPAAARDLIRGAPADPVAILDFVERQIRRRATLPPTLHWGISPSGPQRSSRTLLEGVADLGRRHALPIFTHVYETKAQAAKARRIYDAHGGSMIRYMADAGLLGPRTTLAHSVWITPEEIELLGTSGTNVAHNPISNMKLKNGIAPIKELRNAGVTLAVGCDNCSCSDCQNIFEVMKMFCLLAAVANPEPTGVHAVHAIEAATSGGARAVGLDGKIGAVRAGLTADLCLIDLDDVSYVPLNSAARQLVYSECGRGVDTVIVGGRILMRNRRTTTIDEAALRAEVADLMPVFLRDAERIRKTSAAAVPCLLEANANVDRHQIGLDRFITRRST